MSQKSLALIADNDAIRESVAQAVAELKDLKLETHVGTLTSVNGHAQQLMNAHDLLVVGLSKDHDLDAIRALRRSSGWKGTLLALSSDDISLAEARALNKSGVDEILPFPISQQELTEQIERLTVDKSRLPALYNPSMPRSGQIICICSARGGNGASTLAINLADQLQGHAGFFKKKTNNKVAVVDLDLQFGTLATALDLKPSPAFMKMAQNGVVPDATFLKQSMVRHDSGLEVLTAPDEFIPLDVLTREQISALIEALRLEFDYVVIDLPRALVDWLGAVVTAANRVLMVGDSSVPSINQACRLIDFFSKERLEPPIEIVIGRESKPTFGTSHLSEARKALGRELKYWLPEDRRHAKQALDRGQLLSKTAGNCVLSKAIRAMSRKIMDDASIGQIEFNSHAA
jgi:pilus assembly protein CpaE